MESFLSSQSSLASSTYVGGS